MSQNTKRLTVGLFGKDSGNDFEITETREAEVKIRYIKDGRTAWFQRNRFDYSDTLTLN